MDSTVTTMVLVLKADILDPVPFLFSVLYYTQFRYCNNCTLWWLYYFVVVLLMLALSIASILSSISVSLCLIRFVS